MRGREKIEPPTPLSATHIEAPNVQQHGSDVSVGCLVTLMDQGSVIHLGRGHWLDWDALLGEACSTGVPATAAGGGHCSREVCSIQCTEVTDGRNCGRKLAAPGG